MPTRQRICLNAILVLLSIAGVSCQNSTPLQDDIEIAEYKKSNAVIIRSEQIKIENSDFSQGRYAWDCGTDYKIEATGGVNGNAGLFYERNNPDSYKMCSSLPIKVIAGKRYKFGVWVRGESLNLNGKKIRCVAVDFSQNGKFIGGSYPAHQVTEKWTYAEGSFITNKDCDAKVILYMERGATGRLWFDNPNIYCSEVKDWMIHQLYPKMSLFFADDPEITLKVAEFGNVQPGVSVYTELKDRKGTVVKALGITDKDGIVKLNFRKDLSLGDAVISVKVIDCMRKEILAEKEIPVKIEKNKPTWFIRKNGTLVVNGKAFMPIGLYMSHISREDISRLVGHFNCVMPYNSLTLKLKNSEKKGLDAIGEVLDELHKNNIKMIFSLKDIYDGFPIPDKVWKLFGAESADRSVELIVDKFKEHPALLAWYIGDEIGYNGIERLEKRRKLINKIDSKHPTWTVHCIYGDLPLFASTNDVIGVDPYPVEKPGIHEMSLITEAMNAVDKTCLTEDGGAIWGVVQFFNWGNYDQKGMTDREYRLKNFIDPTEDEMRSMCFLMLIKGAKGIIGYSYFDLFTKGAMPDADKRWPEVCRVGEMLKYLEPFIVSEKDGPAVTVETKQGEVFAKAFADEKGNVKVLIAGIGPGKSEAIINVPQNMNLKSRFGGTKLSSPGKYLFQGNDICSDILE